MVSSKRALLLCAYSLVLSTFSSAHFAVAQQYPTKPIRLIVPFTPGGGPDILARIIGPKLYEAWGQQVVVDNRPSAGGTVGGGIVAGAAPNGYTLLVTTGAFPASAALYDNLPYDSVRDFAGVALLYSGAQVVVAAPSLNLKTLKALIALARQKPKQLNFASAGIGSGIHYAAELFNNAAGIVAVHVPYKGTPEAINDTISGRTQYALPPLLAALPLVKSGRLSALAVTTLERSPLLPDAPTVAEAALPGFEFYGWAGILAPAKTPRPVVMRLNKEVNRLLETAELRDKLAAMGATAKPGTPEVFEKLVRDEIVTRRKIFSAAGVKPE